MSAYWGELPVLPETASGIAAIEREQMTKPRPIEIEGPQLHQPSSQHFPPTSEPHPAEQFALDSVTTHTIKLIQHARKVRSMMHSVQQQLDSLRATEGEKEMPTFPAAPPVPEYSGPPLKHQQSKPLAFLAKDPDSKFARGIGTAPPVIDSKTNRKLLRRSVAAVCAHAGYDNCPESVLETLTDISNEYLLQMTRQLRYAVDNEAAYGGTSFQDPMEQVFHEMGIGSTRTLHDFYQQRVLQYHKNQIDTCHQLVQEYEKMRNPETRLQEEVKPAVRVKEEPAADIQFPSLEESEENLENDQVMHLEAGLGLDINIVQDSSGTLTAEDEQKWSQVQGGKSEPSDTNRQKLESSRSLSRTSQDGDTSVAVIGGVSTLDSYDQDDNASTGDIAHTPAMGSDADSLQDPGSIPVSDIMSPPSIGHVRAANKQPPTKKLKKK